MRRAYDYLRAIGLFLTIVYRKLDGKRLTPTEAWWWAHWLWFDVERMVKK